MFTLLRNYRTMFISTIFSGLNNAEGASTPDAVVKPDVETTPEEKAAAEVVRRVTKEDLENVVAVQNYLESHSSIKEGAKGPAVKDIQQILLFLDIDISFTSSRTGKKVEGLDAVDGDYGSTMIKAVKEFQKTHKDPNGEPLDIDGKVGKVTYEAMLVAANIKGEVSAEAATVGVESMSAVKQAERARTIAGEDAFFASETAAAAEAAAAAVEAVAVEARGMIEEARVILAELEDTMSDELGLRERIREAYTAANNVVLEAEITQGADEELQVVASNVRDSAQILVDSAMTVKEAERAQSDAAKIVLEKAENELALVEGNKIGEAAEAKEAENNLAIAQTEFDALGFTGNFDDIPTLIDAEAAAEAAEAAAEAAEAAAEAAEAAAEEAKRAWDEGPFYGSASLKDTMDSTKLASDLARSAATTARSTATTANDLIVISKGYDKVVSAEVVLQAESIDLQDAISDFHLAQVARDSAQAEFDKEKAEFDIATDILSDRILFRNQKDIALTEANKALNEANNALTLAQEEQHKIGMELDTKFEYLEEIRIRLLAIQDAMPGINANFDAVEEAAAEAAAEAAEAAEAADNAGRLYKEARGEYTTTVETQEYNEYYSPEHALAALEGMKNEKGAGAIIAIQKALIVAGANLGPSGADGIAGKLTRVAVQANPDVTLTTLAAYIDATDKAIVEKRVITERPIAGDAIDAALDNLFSDDIDDLNASLDQVAKEFTGKDVDANTRNVNAQYIAIKLQSLGQEDSPMAQSLMEKIMAEGKGNYENESNELNIRQALIDGSGRFARHLGTFSENFTGSYFKIGQTLQGRDSRSRIENGMQQGIEGTASEVLQVIFGVDADFIAHRMHMVAGQGVDGDVDMSLELGNGIDLENAYYDKVSGAIYATVAKGNGCEGNLVVIPVETFTQTITQAPKSSGTSNSFQQELIPVDPSISDFPEIEVDCNGEILKAEYVTSYEGYQVYIAAGKVFRVIDGGLESRNFGLNEGMAWKGMTAENVKDNIGDIMKNGTISILGLFKLADHWEFVGTTQNVCTVPIEGDGGGGKGPGSENDSSTPGHGGASDNGGGGSNGDGSGGRS